MLTFSAVSLRLHIYPSSERRSSPLVLSVAKKGRENSAFPVTCAFVNQNHISRNYSCVVSVLISLLSSYSFFFYFCLFSLSVTKLSPSVFSPALQILSRVFCISFRFIASSVLVRSRFKQKETKQNKKTNKHNFNKNRALKIMWKKPSKWLIDQGSLEIKWRKKREWNSMSTTCEFINVAQHMANTSEIISTRK